MDLEELSLQLGGAGGGHQRPVRERAGGVDGSGWKPSPSGRKKTYRVKVDYGPQLEEAISLLEPAVR